jgi:site-specific recombinase XerD
MVSLLEAPLKMAQKKPGKLAGRKEPAWAKWRDTALLELLYGTGLRLGEALSLSWRGFHEEGKRTLRVRGKGGKERLVVLGDAARNAMKNYEERLPMNWRLFSVPVGRGCVRGFFKEI